MFIKSNSMSKEHPCLTSPKTIPKVRLSKAVTLHLLCPLKTKLQLIFFIFYWHRNESYPQVWCSIYQHWISTPEYHPIGALIRMFILFLSILLGKQHFSMSQHGIALSTLTFSLNLLPHSSKGETPSCNVSLYISKSLFRPATYFSNEFGFETLKDISVFTACGVCDRPKNGSWNSKIKIINLLNWNNIQQLILNIYIQQLILNIKQFKVFMLCKAKVYATKIWNILSKLK